MNQLDLDFDSVLPPANDRKPRQVQLSAKVLHYSLLRARRRTIGIYIAPHGVEVRAPRHARLAEIEGFLREKERWIFERLADWRRSPPPFAWRSGSRLPLLGRPVMLCCIAGTPGVRLLEDRLEIGGEPDSRNIRARALAWLRREALDHFRSRSAEFSPRLQVGEPSIGLSNAQTLWGSCCGKRVLFNWRLYLLPARLVDYVVVHELAHLRELNHSKRFWALVESVYPDCGAARAELRRRAHELPEI